MLPNAITLVRLVLLVPLFWLLSQGLGSWLALGLFLLTGATDVLDGQLARRLGLTSRLGAMLDLIADRLLTLAVLLGLMIGGTLHGPAVIAAAILIARDLVVASLNEALPGKLEIRVSLLERVKIALHWLGAGLLMAPAVLPQQSRAGAAVLALSAFLALYTLADYGLRARRALQEAP